MFSDLPRKIGSVCNKKYKIFVTSSLSQELQRTQKFNLHNLIYNTSDFVGGIFYINIIYSDKFSTKTLQPFHSPTLQLFFVAISGFHYSLFAPCFSFAAKRAQTCRSIRAMTAVCYRIFNKMYTFEVIIQSSKSRIWIFLLYLIEWFHLANPI